MVLAAGAEWTVEANPGTLDAEKADILAEAGVNRVSLGAQSFRTESLRVLERHHGRPEVEQAVAIVRPRFPRWSLDLIFGVPGSTLDDLGSRPGHCPRLRPGAPVLLRAGLREGDCALETAAGRPGPSRSTRRSNDRCMRPRSTGSAAPGWRCTRSPISREPGHESRHNLAYWANDAYFGFGVGAARYIRGVRSVNTRDLAGYLRRIEAGEPATGPVEKLTPRPGERLPS